MSWLPSWLNGMGNNSTTPAPKKNTNIFSLLNETPQGSPKANEKKNIPTMKLGNITYKKNNKAPMFSTPNVLRTRMEEAQQPVNIFTRRRALAELPVLKQQLERYAWMYTGKTLAELETAHPIYKETLYANPPVQELLQQINEYERQLGTKGGYKKRRSSRRHRRKTYKKKY